MKETFYLTTPIFYPNAKLHMGHAYVTTISDIIVRYHRLKGDKTYFLTGSDENAETMVAAAKKGGKDPIEFLNDIVLNFMDLYKSLNISYDQFIRTTDQENHWPGAKLLWEKMVSAGDIYKKEYEGLYCVGHEAFMTEKDLTNGKCPDHETIPELVREENYFFRLSRHTKQIKEKIESGELKIVPESRKNEILSLLSEGLEDVSFSRPRRKDWPKGLGIPVPGDNSQVMYVWCDALSNYITALGYGRDASLYKEFWPANVHVIGKDILRFHAAIWPGMLISADLPLPKSILVHGFITSGGKKMSKTIGNVVDPKEIVNKYGVEAFRYFMAREISPFEDGDFTEEKFIESYNANLANGLGNLVSRIMKMAETYLEKPAETSKDEFLPLKFSEFQVAMENFNIQLATDIVWENISRLDEAIQKEEPFKVVKEDKEKGILIIKKMVNDLFIIAKYLEPFLPDTAKRIQGLIQENKMPEKSLFPRVVK